MRKIIIIALFISILITTIVYSAFSTQLQISGEAIVRSDNDIRITNIKVLSQTNNAYETYNNKYTKDTTSMFVTLPSNSNITYEVNITNKIDKKYIISNISELSHTNSNVNYIINEDNIITNPNSNKKFTITLTNNTLLEQQETLLLSYLFEEVESTFITGNSFNAKIKQLAGNINTTSETIDTNITRIVRASTLPNGFIPTPDNTLSTNDSTVPIYAWFDNGVIYYYSDAINPYLNSNSSNMFRGISKVKNIELSTIDTSKLRTSQYIFLGTNDLATIDLSNFDTSKMTDFAGMFEGSYFTSLDLSSFDTSQALYMHFMFSGASNLKSIKFGDKFNTSKITNFRAMFQRCISLESLDLSLFDMSKATNTTLFITENISLDSIKTPNIYPTDSSITIDLPKILYDSNNNSYSSLNSTSPTQTWLRINN